LLLSVTLAPDYPLYWAERRSSQSNSNRGWFE